MEKIDRSRKLNKYGLTPRQEKFCQEYAITNNRSEAYRRAYSTKNMKEATVNNNAYMLMKNSDILERVKMLQNKALRKNEITLQEIVGTLANIARFDIADIYDEDGNLKPLNEISKKRRSAISEVESSEIVREGKRLGVNKKIKTHSKLQAIEMLMKHFGGFEKDNKQKLPETVEEIPREERDMLLDVLIEKYKGSKK